MDNDIPMEDLENISLVMQTQTLQSDDSVIGSYIHKMTPY
jgi:hypothetical protein